MYNVVKWPFKLTQVHWDQRQSGSLDSAVQVVISFYRD